MAKRTKDDTKRDLRMDFMTQEDIRMVDDYMARIEQNRGSMGTYYTRWDKEQEAYSGDQDLVDNRPNSRVNIINANVEGQVDALVEQNIAITCRGEGPSDQSFSNWARIGLDWTLRKNRIKGILRRHEFRRELFGPAWFKLHFDADAIDGFGLVRFTCPPLQSVFVDMKINDPLNIQDADYIAEVMPKSKTWAKKEYGDVAESINYGGQDRASVFRKDFTTDDIDLFWLIQVWTKTDGKLRLIEFSDDGVLLRDSFKRWNGKRFEDIDDPEPFYRGRVTRNKYPYFLTNMYYEEGKLYGFGDGKLLRPLQDMLNDIYDQIRRQAKPNRIFFDPGSEVELEDIDEDDGPVPCNDPNQNIRVVEVGRVNPGLWQLLAAVHQEVQRVTRFSELMMGQKSTMKTATEASIQQQQGATSTDGKKGALQETLEEACEYALDLMMEFYDGEKAFRIDEDKDDYAWIDFRQMNRVPAMVPATEGFAREFQTQNPEITAPQWQQLTDEQGNPVTKSVDLDIEINIGQGLPKNKSFLYQMLDRLSQMVVEGRNVITWQEMRNFSREFLGLPLEDDQMVAQRQMEQMAAQAAAEAAQKGEGAPTESADVAGITAGGAPMQTALPETGLPAGVGPLG